MSSTARSSTARISVLLAEDHPLYRAGLAEAIRRRPELALIAEAENGRVALETIRESRPAVAVLDLKMPDLDGMRVLHALERDGIGTRVLFVSAFCDGEFVHEALAHGAAGFLSKDSSGREICEAISEVARGGTALAAEIQSALAGELRVRGTKPGPRLSDREAEILRLLADGLSAGEIADELMVGTSTVKTHLRNLYEKLSVSDRAAAVASAMRRGLLE